MSEQNPTQAQPTPPFPKQQQEPPGTDAEMRPLADHGEDSYVGHERLKDRIALITGADSGIGRAVAIAFAREGADVLCSYWNEDEDAAETRELVEAAGRRCVTVAGDIGDGSWAWVNASVSTARSLLAHLTSATCYDPSIQTTSRPPRRRSAAGWPRWTSSTSRPCSTRRSP